MAKHENKVALAAGADFPVADCVDIVLITHFL